MISHTVDVSLRQALDSDANAIRKLLEESNLPTESLGRNTTEFFVAESAGTVVGIAGFEFYGEDALLRSVAIRADVRNSGIGSRLVDWMIDQAKERGIEKIVLLTETARKFFERKGFAVVDRSTIVNNAMTASSEFTDACPTSATCMMLRL